MAVDFETANETRGSACSVGIALLRDGDVVAVGSTLINPEQEFNPYNSMVNGIDEAAVAGSPTFPEIFPALTALLDGKQVVAHNASFDMSVLRNTAGRYASVLSGGPSFDVFCSYRLAKVSLPGLPSYGLHFLARLFAIDFFHHQAAEDAAACLELTQHLCALTECSNLGELAAKCGMNAGRTTADSYKPFSSQVVQHLKARDGEAAADPSHPLYGKTICFTGGMVSMPRREAQSQVTAVGCNFRNSVSMQLDYLVLGDTDFAEFADGHRTTKLAKAMSLIESGAEIEIIPERQFLELLLS